MPIATMSAAPPALAAASAAAAEPDLLFGLPTWLFSVLLLVVVCVIAFLYGGLKARLGKARAEKAEDAKLAAHHTVRWSVDRSRFRPEPVHWGLAVAAPFALCWGEDWDRMRHRDVKGVRDMLSQSWGVSDRDSMLRTLYDTLTHGHRMGFGEEVAVWSTLDEKQASGIEAAMREDAPAINDVAETLWRFRRVRANDRGIREVDFTAWDLVRCAMLARCGATAGYLSDAEAQDFLLLLADDLRARYSSWQELGESFLTGRWYWNSQGGDGERETDRHDRSRQNALLAENSPWSAVPWNMTLPQSRGLFIGALAQTGVVRLLEPGAGRPTAWEQRIDEQLRAYDGG